MNTYKALNRQVYSAGDFSIVPIRDEDRYEIMNWRNEQIYHLRQKELLTEENQDLYFDQVVKKLFDEDFPSQLLFSYLEKDKCMGYGGLVHINWINKHAEISFIMATSLENESFAFHWKTYLHLIEMVAFQGLNFHKIFTYAFDLRPHLYHALEEEGFEIEGRLREHCFFEEEYIDVVIHSKLNDFFKLRIATADDLDLAYEWVNKDSVRRYSIQKEFVAYKNHCTWFLERISSQDCLYYIAEIRSQGIGSFRVDRTEEGALISFLLDPEFHGKGLGAKLLGAGIEKIKQEWPKILIVAYVVRTNVASFKLFQKLNFQESIHKDGLVKFVLKT